MVQELPWLPRPRPEDRAQLEQLSKGADAAQVIARLRALAAIGWDEAGLRTLGRKLRQALSSSSETVADLARHTGCVRFSLLLVSSNTANHLVDALIASALRAGILLECRFVEYEEPETWIATQAAHLAADPPDASLIALDGTALHLQSPVGDAARAVACIETALERVGRIAGRLAAITQRSVIVQTLAPNTVEPQSSMDAWLEGSARRLRAQFNDRLAAYAREHSWGVFDAAAIADLVGHAQWVAGRYWYVAKLPFAPACVPLYGYRLTQLLAAMLGKSRRVLVLDLDNTLWGGIIGDDGIGGIVLGPGTARGEAHLAIQRLALHYKERGVVLCVASKNNIEIAREAITQHPEMLLRESDIALLQINWEDKAANLSAMAEALDLGLESFVFVDDNPVERKQVRDALAAVAVPELPDDPAAWPPIIQAAGYFEQVTFSAEDLARTDYYRGNAQRSVQAKASGDHQEFLRSLQMVMTVAPFDALGRPRIAQLIAKSNQFNLTTRRYSASEVADLQAAPDIEALQIRLEDLFGDNGMISVVICRKHAAHWDIDTWIMSCRVLGRGVEQAVLALLVARARAAGVRKLHGSFLPTAKNALVRDHYAKLGFSCDGEIPGGGTKWSLTIDGFVAADVPIEIRERVLAEGGLPQSPERRN